MSTGEAWLHSQLGVENTGLRRLNGAYYAFRTWLDGNHHLGFTPRQTEHLIGKHRVYRSTNRCLATVTYYDSLLWRLLTQPPVFSISDGY